MATTLGQRCTVFLDAGGIQRFKIDSSIDSVLAGDLPLYGPSPYTSNIFVHKIINPLDPKSDTFLRVGTVADLTTLALGRESAVGLNQTLYLSTEFSVTYDDIATASSAKVLIQQRVDNLIADWHTYNEKFLAPVTTPPNYSVITMPLTDSIVSERQAEYNTAHAEYLASKTDTATAAAEVTVTTAAAVSANEGAIKAVDDSQQCSTMLGHFNSGNTALIAYRNAVNSFIASSVVYEAAVTTFVAAADVYRAIAGDPSPAQEATYDAAKSTYVSAKATYDSAMAAMNAAVVTEATNAAPVLESFRSEMATACTTKISDVAIAASKKKDADKAAAEAATAKKAADEAQSAALLADTAAYMSLKEVCPTAERIVP
jgi:hypothetical protein